MKKIKICNAIIIFLLCFCVTIIGTSGEVSASNKDAKISQSELAIYLNSTKQIKMMNVSSKVKWSSSNNKIVSILGSKGKNNQTVTIRTKNRIGSCKIKAKVNGKTYICKINVKKDTDVSRVKLVKVTKTSQKIKVKVKIHNKTNKDIEYGTPYVIEKFVNGSWKKVAPRDGTAFDSKAICIPANSSKTETYTVAGKSEVKRFTKGTYRLRVDIHEKNINKYVIFTLDDTR